MKSAITAATMVAIAATAGAMATEVNKDNKCYTNKDFKQIIDDKGLVTIFNNTEPGKKTTEVMMAKAGEVWIVEYDFSTEKGGATGADSYCVEQIMRKPSFNESAIEFLYDLMNKVKGQKT